MNYVCLYCGENIEPNQVLFFNETTQRFEDNVRFDFLEKHGMFAEMEEKAENKYGRLYYHATEENVTRRDKNGFPTLISARPCDGMTAAELYQAENAATKQKEDAADEEKGNDSIEEEFAFASQSSFGMFGAQENQTESTSPFQQATTEQAQKPTDTASRNIPSRACPHCHCELPADFGLIPVHSIQLLGGRACGKTAFLTCLHQQLNKQLVANFLGSAYLEKESEEYLKPKIAYYEQVGTPRPTPLNENIFPLVYHVVTGNDNFRNSAFITIHDVAGEGMTGHTAYLYNLRGVAQSRNFVYLFDANQLNEGGYYTSIGLMQNGQNAAGYQECNSANLLSTVQSIGANIRAVLGDGQGFDNIVAVMSKIDMPLMVEKAMFGHGNMVIMNDIGNAHSGMINKAVLAQVHMEISQFVDAKYGAPMGSNLLIQAIKDAFLCPEEKIFLSGISTYTRSEITTNADHTNHFDFKNLYNSQGTKHRIIEPFLLLLWRFGMLPARYGDIISYLGELPETEGKKKNEKRGLFGRKKQRNN